VVSGDRAQEVFHDVAAITDYTGNLELTFIDYNIDEKPKYSVEECKARDATYAAPLKVVCGSATRKQRRSRNKRSSWEISQL
jgi:DNA-directed RNA polymerase beta subunit